MSTDREQLAALGSFSGAADLKQAAASRDPLVDPMRGDVISYRFEDVGMVSIATVTDVEDGLVSFTSVELLDSGETGCFESGPTHEIWRDWTPFRDVTVLRRGDA